MSLNSIKSKKIHEEKKEAIQINSTRMLTEILKSLLKINLDCYKKNRHFLHNEMTWNLSKKQNIKRANQMQLNIKLINCTN